MKRDSTIFAILLCGLMTALPVYVLAQRPVKLKVERERAVRLVKDKEYAKALPVLEKLAAADKSDREVMYALGVALLMKAVESRQPETQKRMLLRAREALLQAKSLGEGGEFLHDMISRLPLDGDDWNSEAEKLALLISLHPPYIFDEKPGNGIRLLAGYQFRAGSNFEGSGGEIYQQGDLRITYEFGLSQGFAADPKEKEKYAWYREQVINGRKVMLALVKPGLKTQFEPENPRTPEPGNILLITFALGASPKDDWTATNFQAEVLSAEEIADVILMVLTYDP
jgi:hypothetical protein